MRIVMPSAQMILPPHYAYVLQLLEFAGKTAYQSEPEIAKENFLRKIIDKNHLSVIEHIQITVRVICDRGVSHEIVRHRIASYTQESTRYCNYSKEKFGGHVTFIKPFFFPNIVCGEYKEINEMPDQNLLTAKERKWLGAVLYSENTYFDLLNECCSPQEARCILPISLKTSLVMTMNLREWKHFFSLRTAPDAHPQMREIIIPLLKDFQEKYPIVFV